MKQYRRKQGRRKFKAYKIKDVSKDIHKVFDNVFNLSMKDRLSATKNSYLREPKPK